MPGSAVYCVINIVFVNLLYFCILFFIVFRIHFYRISPLTRSIQQTHNFGFSLMTYNTLCILTGKINFCTVQRFHDKNAEIVWNVRWPIFSEFYDEDSWKRFAWEFNLNKADAFPSNTTGFQEFQFWSFLE